MTVELTNAIGREIVGPICGFGVFVLVIWLLDR